MKGKGHIQRFNEHQENSNSELSKETSSSISDVSDSELFTLQDIKDTVTMAFRWGKTIEWGETPEKYDDEEKTLFNEIIKELRLRKSE
jgi:hypothetical protein